MHKDAKAVEDRLERFIRDRITPALYSDRQPLSISAWEVPGEPVAFALASQQVFAPVAIGWRFGRAWSTTWLRVQGDLPTGWKDLDESVLSPEIIVDFGYNRSRSGFQAEALAFDLAGKPIKSIAPLNSWLPWSVVEPKVDCYLEVAANPDVAGEYSFQPTDLGDWDTASEAKLYEIKELHIALKNKTVWNLLQDVWTARGLMLALDPENTRRHALLRALEDMLDSLNPGDIPASASQARSALAKVLSAPASLTSHRIIATGNAHIDSAWLWPIRETIRKCARTFSNVLSLMEDHPDFVFSGSAAQHYDWMKVNYPSIFDGIAKRVKTGQWKPVGGMWVECDGNMPGSEAMARQFILGQKFFQENFGTICKEAWLPDSFGYSGALPQIVRQAGITSFLSQKMSWNQVNSMPHHTFWWEGIDGSRVYTHFPSADTYISELSGAELAHAERNFAEKGRASISLVPYGWGDGGGGPTREMIAAAHRTANLEGSPRVSLGSADEFFEIALAEYPTAPVWRGEMYLELHRGVFTSQLRTKRWNRENEALFRQAELWASYANLKCGTPYPAERLQAAWQDLLLMQFHDILPGASIAWVYREVEAKHREISKLLNQIIDQSLQTLANIEASTQPQASLAAHSNPFSVAGEKPLGIEPVKLEAGVAEVAGDLGSFTLRNQHLMVVIDSTGQIASLINLSDNREAVAPGRPANLFYLHDDIPTRWDAWDIDAHYRRKFSLLNEVDTIATGNESDGEVWVRTTRTITHATGPNTVIAQKISLRPGGRDVELELDIDWHESEKLLKLAFSFDTHSDQVAAETQFGHVWRPTHVNTSWDYARFEACQHRFLYLPEGADGIAIANNSTYGYDVERDSESTGAVTTVRFSILRAPKFPDPAADQGSHQLKFRIRPGASVLDAVRLAYQLNFPPRTVLGNSSVAPLITSSNEQVVIETVKLAEDGSGDMIVRAYEAAGSRALSRIQLAGTAQSIRLTSLLEENDGSLLATNQDSFDIEFRAFQIKTFRFQGVKL